MTVKKILLSIKYVCNIIFKVLLNKPKLSILVFSPLVTGAIRDSIITLILSKIFSLKTILWIHGNEIIDYDNKNAFVKFMIAKALKSSIKLALLGQNQEENFLRFVNRSKIEIVPNGIKPTINIELKTSNIIQRNTNVLYFANFIIEKGWFITLQAASEILKSRKDISFKFHGAWMNETDEGKAQNFISKNNLSYYIKLYGLTNGDAKKNAFKNADIFVFPTYFNVETYPLVILEAFEAGLPVITTSQGCITEIVEDGINGYIIPSKNVSVLVDKIIYLTEHPNIRNKMGQKNREKFLNYYTDEIFASRWASLIEKI